jgi:hypothetical protein
MGLLNPGHHTGFITPPLACQLLAESGFYIKLIWCPRICEDAPIFTLKLEKRLSLRVLNVLLSDLAKKELRHIGNQDPITEAH